MQVDGSSDNPFLVSAQDDVDLDEMELLVLRLQSRNHDESLIRLAKDSGKGIFSHLTNSQRRLKISSAVKNFNFVSLYNEMINQSIKSFEISDCEIGICHRSGDNATQRTVVEFGPDFNDIGRREEASPGPTERVQFAQRSAHPPPPPLQHRDAECRGSRAAL